MGLFSGWDFLLPGITAATSAGKGFPSGDDAEQDRQNGVALGFTGDSATDKQIMKGEIGGAANGAGSSVYPQLNRADYMLAPSTGPDNRMAVTGRGEEAWRAGAQMMPGRAAPTLAGVDRGFEVAAGARQRGAQDVALGGTADTGLLANQMGADRSMYLNAAQGTVPSAAEMQQQQGLAQAMRNQLALASSNRTPGGAYMAQAGAGALQRQVAGDTAVLRANEQAEARNALIARDTAEGNVRNAYVNQALGVGAGETAAYQNALGLNAQELQRQQWGASNQLAQTGLNDQSMMGLMGLSNQFYGTGNDMERTALTRDVAKTDADMRWNEAQADQYQRWLEQWVKFKIAEKDRQQQERGAIASGGGSGVTGLLSLLG